MGASFDDPPIINHQHLVGVANGAQPMSDHKARAAPHQVEKRLLDVDFGARVDARCGLIQEKNAWISQNRPRDSKSCRCPWLSVLARSESGV